jgi:predicted RNase H-like nuclease (RuvC/YqgF family)
MAEFEFAGTTFRGGKMFVVLTALSTLGGGLWAGFEFYKDYMDMKEIVQNIDVDAIAAENEKVILTMDNQMIRIEEAIEYTRDIKSDLRADVMEMEQLVERLEDKTDASEDRVKDSQNAIETHLETLRDEMNDLRKDVQQSIREVEALIRESEKDVRNTMRETEDRIDADMRQLDTDIHEKLQEALDNPLNDQ